MPQSSITIYTDGSCNPNPGVGAWAAILLHIKNDKIISEKEAYGTELNSTNNRSEILAVINGIKLIKHPADVTIYSDSSYVVNSIGTWVDGEPKSPRPGWMVAWKKRGWRKSDGELKNVDLWRKIDALVRLHRSVSMRWVRGHSGNIFNERCDALATEARRLITNDVIG